MMVLEGHGLDVAPKSKVANMLFLAAKITSQLGLNQPGNTTFGHRFTILILVYTAVALQAGVFMCADSMHSAHTDMY